MPVRDVCAVCGADLLQVTTRAGEVLSLGLEPDPDGSYVLTGEYRAVVDGSRLPEVEMTAPALFPDGIVRYSLHID
jgi:hypothetical protein